MAVRGGKQLSGSTLATGRAFARYASALVPLGLAAWIAFSLSFVFASASYLWPVLSDPMGWGWDILGTAGTDWSPYFSGLVPGLQVVVLLGGLWWAGAMTRRIAADDHPRDQAARQALPVIIFHLLVTVGLLWLLVG
jgi:hypothetical protein